MKQEYILITIYGKSYAKAIDRGMHRLHGDWYSYVEGWPIIPELDQAKVNSYWERVSRPQSLSTTTVCTYKYILL